MSGKRQVELDLRQVAGAGWHLEMASIKGLASCERFHSWNSQIVEEIGFFRGSRAPGLLLIYCWPANNRAMKKIIRDFFADETAATAIEYGLIAAGISLAIISIVNNLGTTLKTKFTSINASLK
jgi:pilus assembly protein Flp/PilA